MMIERLSSNVIFVVIYLFLLKECLHEFDHIYNNWELEKYKLLEKFFQNWFDAAKIMKQKNSLRFINYVPGNDSTSFRCSVAMLCESASISLGMCLKLVFGT